MKNVTITLDEETARWARVWAAEHDMSVSRMLGALLEEKMKAGRAYDRARDAFLSRQLYPLRDSASPLPRRDELYDRRHD